MLSAYWDFYWGGIAIAAVAILLTLVTGNFLSITRGYVSACSIFTKRPYFNRKEMGGPFGYRTFFTLGVITGGFLAGLYASDFNISQWYEMHVNFSLGSFDTIFGTSITVKAVVLALGGFLWGYGSRMAGGCTSGNSISGIARGSLSSLVATICFLIAGAIITRLISLIV